MKKLNILLIGGTKDASNITKHIKEKYDSYILTTTTTKYGSKLAIESGSDDTIAKPLLKDEFITLIENNEFNLLIDATHPYASHITQTTVSLSKLFSIAYIRFERPPSNLDNVDTSRIHEVTSLDEAGQLIASDFTSGNVLHLAGANTMEPILKYVPVNRFYARILKVPKSVEKCKMLNLPEEHIIPMKGTSSLEENLKIIEETQASVMITKESGDIGGVTNKINAANLKDIGIIMLKRPKIRDLNTIYSLLDTIGNNITTNMDKNTMLSFYNIFKNIIISSNSNSIDNVIDIKKLSMEVYGTYINISGLNLSMIIPHQNSINAISNAMKENLELKEKETIKALSFNINNPYEEKIIGKGIYGGTTLNLLDDLVGKSYNDALNYCNKINYECEFNYVKITDGSYENDQIINQNPLGNYDMSLIKDKKLVFDIAKVEKNNNKFDYSLCTSKEYANNSKCIIPNFTNKSIDEFNTWYQNFTFIKVKLTEVNDDTKDNDIIVSQNISDKSIYEIYNSENTTIEISYIKNKTTDDNNDNEDTNEDDESTE